jgi:phosphoglycerol transferase MdoB-like AlkP superfamily enzyme
LDTILNTNPLLYVIGLFLIIFAVFATKFMPKVRKWNWKRLLITVVVFLIVHTFTPFLLGTANSSLKWNTFKNPRNIYDNFNDSNKSMKISGMYEYTIRDFYITFLKPEDEISQEDKEFLDSAYAQSDSDTANYYTGLFQGKNLIFLQLEGMDSWMLTKKNTPNLYSLKSNSIDFKNHYSIYTGGGSTFNSEFAVNTGFTTPLSYTENVYSFNTNTFDVTMAKLFKAQNYSVNAFHMNSKDFYSRGINYKSWGYDNYYGLMDVKKYYDESYKLDRELILNETFYNKMFQQSGNFVDYIITYSPHTPFSTKNGVSKMLAKEKYGDDIPELSEEDCALLAAQETDNMVGMLIQALKDNGLYENTVIVAYADHYLYTLKDKSIIWSYDLDYKSVKQVTMQTNILPTVLNLFGISYDSNRFISEDALGKNYSGFAFFPDYSWYDGNVYVENSKVSNKGKISKKKLAQMNEKITNIIRKNDLTLKYDYFKNNN